MVDTALALGWLAFAMVAVLLGADPAFSMGAVLAALVIVRTRRG